MIDLFTRYNVPCVILSKKKEVIVEKILKHWLAIFGYLHKFLTNNGSKFCKDELSLYVITFKIHICSTAVETPWSNGPCRKT